MPERITAEGLGRKVAELLHLKFGQDEVEIQVDKLNADRVMVIRHSGQQEQKPT